MGLSPKQFEQLQARVLKSKARPAPSSALPSTLPTPISRPSVILGIDPSLRGTGWGIVTLSRGHPSSPAHGTIRCPAGWSRSQCLVRIASTLREVIQTHAPKACAIEGLFFAQNLQTALLMGEARGVCLLAAAEAGLEITEIAPRRVKQAIVGFGGAQKIAVARMVQRMLHLSEPPQADAADALALALAHASEAGRPSLRPTKRL